MGSEVLLFFLLALLYATSCSFAVYRTTTLLKEPRAWGQTRLFYASLVVQTMLRAIVFVVAMFGFYSFTLQYLILSLPDSLFISAYLLLFWQLITVYRISHITAATAMATGRSYRRMEATAAAILLGSVVWLGLETCLYTALVLGWIGTGLKDEETEAVNIVIPVIVLSAWGWLQCRYSGTLCASRPLRELLDSTSRVTLIWTLCRLLRGAVGFFAQFGLRLSIVSGLMDYSNPQHIVASILYISVLLLSEILCYFLVLDSHFFKKCACVRETEASITVESQLLSAREEVRVEDTEELEPLIARKHALGTIYKARHNLELIAVRRITFPRLNTYLWEEFLDEVEQLRRCAFQHVSHVIGGSFDELTVKLFTPYAPMGSLHALLHSRKEVLGMLRKMTIAREVCMGMRELYAEGRTHGHLTSYNVLITPDGAKVTDAGLHKLKKFAGVVLNYTNKGAWSSPEQLQMRGRTTSKVVESDDIYSFGVVLWELASGEEPFTSVSLEALREMVVEQQLRPEIPPGTEEELSQMIKACWNANPERRPGFSKLHSTLTELCIRTEG